MNRKALWRDLQAFAEAGFDHPPARGTLQAPECQNTNELWLKPGRQEAPRPEKRHWSHHRNADETAEQAVRPLKEEDEFKAVHIHAGEKRGILRNLLVVFELGLPLGLAQGWNHARHRLPLGDGKARFRKPCGAPDDHHQKNESGKAPKPNRNSELARASGVCDSARRWLGLKSNIGIVLHGRT